MSLVEKINSDKIAAMKAKAEDELATLRLVGAALKNAEIAKRGPLTDLEAQQVLRTERKKRQEAAEAFIKGDKEDLAAKERREADVITAYLPEPLSAVELENIIKQVLSENNFTEISQFGQAMGLVMKATAGRAEGSEVQVKVKELLGK
jgi:hypothetical protein